MAILFHERTQEDVYKRQGQIIERGNHQELLKQKGYYYELYSKQFEEESAMQAFSE